MGIRYFAKAVTAEQVDRARHDPMFSVCCCPDENIWDDQYSPLPTLDLDKAWGAIQGLLGLERGWNAREDARPAAELVRGGSIGMEAYRRLLPPDVVERAASDLELFFRETGRALDEDDVDGFSETDCVETHLTRARRFVSGLVGTGHWVYYAIG